MSKKHSASPNPNPDSGPSAALERGKAARKPKPAKSPSLAACCCDGLQERLPEDLFKALGDANRLALLARLAMYGRPATVTEIACCLPVDLSVVSRHLRQLRDAGVLDSEKRGKEVRYFVRYDTIVSTLRGIADAISACCPPDSSAGCCCGSASESPSNTKSTKRGAGPRR